MNYQISIGRDAAIQLAESLWWKDKGPREIVAFQLFVEELSMPFDLFHAAVEVALDRPVWTHEFAYIERLQAEFLGNAPAPSFDEICALIPEDKRVVIVIGEQP